jgi:hypothetical protein
MNIRECLDTLEWKYNYEDDEYKNIECSCDGELEFRGFIGIEVIECLSCGKHMIDLFSPMLTSNSTCTILNSKDFDYEEDRHWIAIDNNNGVKL